MYSVLVSLLLTWPAVLQPADRLMLTGNICRSPTAEAVFKAVVERRGLTNRFIIDSCGTGGGSPDWYACICRRTCLHMYTSWKSRGTLA